MASRKLDDVDESGVDRSYFHGTIPREVAVERLQEQNTDGAFLLRMSATQKDVYTISVQTKGEIKHIRINNMDGKYTLGKSKDVFDSVWDLIENQLDKSLKSTKGNDSVELVYPLSGPADAIAPDLLKRAAEAGMDPSMFGADVMAFMTGGVSTEELARRREAAMAEGGLAALNLKE